MQAKYELTVVLPKDDKDTLSKVKGLVNDFVTKVKGKILKEESWGVRELAYPIKKQQQALYEHFVLEVEAQKQPELHHQLSLEEKILRYLFVRV